VVITIKKTRKLFANLEFQNIGRKQFFVDSVCGTPLTRKHPGFGTYYRLQLTTRFVPHWSHGNLCPSGNLRPNAVLFYPFLSQTD